jgi:uncharacterized cupin superfamily protein
MAVFLAAIAAAAIYHSGKALATAPKGYRATSLAKGRFVESDLSGFFPHEFKMNGDEDFSVSVEESRASSDIYIQSNVWAPGGSTGWHSHPGNSLIIVTAGTVTDYEGHDPDCKPHVYKTGMAFADPGGGHVHILRNEGAIEARTIAVQFTPAGVRRRNDVADPGNCHF